MRMRGFNRWQPSPTAAIVVAVALALVVNLATSTVQIAWSWWPAAVWLSVVVMLALAVVVEVRRHMPFEIPAAQPFAGPRQPTVWDFGAQPHRRYFVGAATTRYHMELDLEPQPEFAAELERMAGLFAELRYEPVPGFGINVGAEQFRQRLRSFLMSPERRASDVVAVYCAGYGHVDGPDLLLPMADSTADIAGTALWVDEFTTRLLRGTVVQRLLYIVDICHSVAGAPATGPTGVDFFRRLSHLHGGPTVAIMVATRPREKAAAAMFTRAFAGAVRNRASGGTETPFLPLDGLVNIVNDTTPDWQHARLFIAGDAVDKFLPNPRQDGRARDFDERIQALRQLQATRHSEQRDHVLPRAQGLDLAAGQDLWLFTGRRRALREVCAWLHGECGPATLVVTADPGSGKSALLSRLFVLADRKLRNRIPDFHELPADTLPAIGSITRFIHARGLTPGDVIDGLGEACGAEDATTPGQLLAALERGNQQVVVIIDAVDEAIGGRSWRSDAPSPLVDEVLAPLIRAVGRTRLRLLLGTRRHLLPALGANTKVIDLDAEGYADRASIRRYAMSCLIKLSETSPYRDQPVLYVHHVARAIAEAAGNSFLVALITARSLALRTELVDPADSSWRESLPREAAEAMSDDLDLRLGVLAGKARDLLLPLAYAQGAGLPWEDLWPALARSLTGIGYASDDIAWLLEFAGYYVVESTQDGVRSAYRLYSDALAEHLRAGRDPVADQSAIVDVLVGRAPLTSDRRIDWVKAHPYVRSQLATTAAGAHRLDEFVTDPTFLLAADGPSLLPALSSVTTPEGRAAADAYRRAAARLRSSKDHERPAYLQLAARCARSPRLADAIATCGLPLAWTTDWASWRLQPPHRTINGHTDRVHAVAVGQMDGRDIIASAGADRTVRLWDPATGGPIGPPLAAHTAPIRTVTITHLDGRTAIVSAGDDGTVRIFDALTGNELMRPLTGHEGAVMAVATGRVARTAMIASAGTDGTVRLWEAATGTPLRPPFTGHDGPVRSVTAGTLENHSVVVSGGSDGTVRVWDCLSGQEFGRPCLGHDGEVASVAIGQIDGREVVISAGADGTVRIWDPRSGRPIGQPYGGHGRAVNAVAVAQLDRRTVIISGGEDATVRMWDAATGTPVGQPYAGHTGVVRSVAVGQLSLGTIIVSGGNDTTVRVWDAATGAPIADPFTGHTGRVLAVVGDRLGNRPTIVSSSADTTVRVWDAATGEQIGNSLSGHTGWVWSVATAHADGRVVAVSGGSDGAARVWDVGTGRPVGQPIAAHRGGIRSVAVGQFAGRTVVVTAGTDRTVRLWELNSGRPFGAECVGHTSTINAVAVGRVDGRDVIVSGGSDATVRLWDPLSGNMIGGPLTGHTGRVLSVATGRIDGREVIVSAGSDTTVRLWDALSGAPFGKVYTGHTGAVQSVTIRNVEERDVVVSGSADHTIQVWDPLTGGPVGQPYKGHTGRVRAVSIGKLDGARVVVSASSDRTIRMWDAGSGNPKGKPFIGHAGWVRSVVFGHIGGRPVVVSGGADHTVRLWDPLTCRQIGSPITGHAGWVLSVALGHLGQEGVIVSGSTDATVRVWDAASGRPRGAPFIGHTGWVWSVAVGRVDGREVIVSGSADHTVRLWDLAAGEPIGPALSGHRDGVLSVAIGQIGGRSVIVSGGADSTVRVWDAQRGVELAEPFTGHAGWVNAVALGKLDGRTVIMSGADDGTVWVRDTAGIGTNAATVSLPKRIDLAAVVYGAALAPSRQLVVATTLGVASLRLLS